MKIFTITLMLTLGCALSSFASQDEHENEHHGHEGQHGGYFADANDILHFEFIFEQTGMLKVYLYDEVTEPMKVTNVDARWVLAPENDYPLKGNFNKSEKDEYYWVKFPEHHSEIVHLKIEAQKKGEWIPLEYYLPVGKKV